MLIEMYADAVCPWAYIGKHHLDEALAIVEGTTSEIKVRWRPFLIDPTAPSPSITLAEATADLGIRAEYERLAVVDYSDPRGGQFPAYRAQEVAESLGIGSGWSPTWRANSWGAQRLITSAAIRGWKRQSDVAQAVMTDHFLRGQDLGRVDVLARIAQGFDLPAPPSRDGRVVLAYMEPGAGDALERQTREGYLSGLAIAVESSPTWAIDGAVVARGAQSPERLVNAINVAIDAGPTARREPEEVMRLRYADALVRAGNPYGALYLLDALRPLHDGDRALETITARALLGAANLKAARDKLAELLEKYPDDVELHWLMGRTLRRLGDPAAAQYLAMGGALDV